MQLCVFSIFSFDNKIEEQKLQNITFINIIFKQKKTPIKYASKKEKKNLAREEVLKDIQKLLDEEDDENISDEDVNLDKLYGEKSIFVSFYQYIVSNCQLIFAFISLHVF